MADFNENLFFNLLDEAEALMDGGFPLSDNTDLVDRVISAAEPSPLIGDAFSNLYERINTFGEGEMGRSLLINFFNVARRHYGKTLSNAEEVESEETTVT